MCEHGSDIATIRTEIGHIKACQKEDRVTLKELFRALYGHDGEVGLIAKVNKVEETFKDVKKAVWAVVLLLTALVVTDLYSVVTSMGHTLP